MCLALRSQAIKSDYTLHDGCTGSDGDTCGVHKGFYDTYVSMRDDIIDAVTAYSAKYPSANNVRVTGHSLGAALAQHCTLDLAVCCVVCLVPGEVVRCL